MSSDPDSLDPDSAFSTVILPLPHRSASRNELTVYKTCRNAILEECFLGDFELKLKYYTRKV